MNATEDASRDDGSADGPWPEDGNGNPRGPRESTESLVQKAQAGDRPAMERLLRRHANHLRRLIELIAGPRVRRQVEVEDLLQDAYVRVIQGLKKFQWMSNRSFRNWLGGIAAHVVQDRARRIHTKKSGGGRVEALGERPDVEMNGQVFLAVAFPSPSTVLRRKERFERLQAAMDALQGDYREVIILARVRGLRMADVGAHMNRSREAASVLLLRALRKLKENFGTTGSFSLPWRELDGGDGDAGQPPDEGQPQRTDGADGGDGNETEPRGR